MTKKKEKLKETEKYKKVIEQLRTRQDALHRFMFMAVCGFGIGFNYQSCSSKAQREKMLKEDHAKYFDIPDIEEFFKDENDARLFFGINKSAEYVLHDQQYGHWFSQTFDRGARWNKVKNIINDACMRIYNKPWGKQKQKVANLIEPIGKYIPIPEELKDRRGNLDLTEMTNEQIIPYLVNRKVYFKNTLIGTVKEVKEYPKYLFTITVKNNTWEDDEPEYFNKDFHLPCPCSLYLHEYNMKTAAKPYVEFEDWIGNVIPMIDFSQIYVTDNKIVLKANTCKLLDQYKSMAY